MTEKSKITNLVPFSIVSSVLYYIINYMEKIDIYMDEEFHLEQTLSYFKNDFKKWNPSLTTFPGTFLLSSYFLKLFSYFKIQNEFHPIKIVRLLPIFISSFSFILLGLFKKKINIDNRLIKKMQLLICFFPINFFYNFLFYTETFSICSLIIFFYLNLYASKKYILTFISGIICISMRQNNIIWVNLLALNETISLLQNFFNNRSIKALFKEIYSLLIRNLDILIIDILFICFFIKNDFSIVLGDKSHHKMIFHLAQINHLLIFSLLFFPAFNLKVLRNLSKVLNSGKKAARFVLLFIAILAFVFFCNRFSYVHDFILSDNRHYIFYYFKKIYLNDNLRNALLIYVSFVYSILINDNIQILKDNRIISWFICSILCLSPSKLVEMRYFAPCYIILIILVKYNKGSFDDLFENIFSWLNIFIHLIINVITFFIFLFKPFQNKFMDYKISRFMY